MDRSGELVGYTFGGGAPGPGTNELPFDRRELEPMPGQLCPLRDAPGRGAVGAADLDVDVVDVVGAAELVVVEGDDAAFASAAPPPATAAVTTAALRTDLIRIPVSPPYRVSGGGSSASV